MCVRCSPDFLRADLGFPVGAGTNRGWVGGVVGGFRQHKILPNFSKKLHEIGNILGHRGCVPGPSPRSATVKRKKRYRSSTVKSNKVNPIIQLDHFTLL